MTSTLTSYLRPAGAKHHLHVHLWPAAAAVPRLPAYPQTERELRVSAGQSREFVIALVRRQCVPYAVRCVWFAEEFWLSSKSLSAVIVVCLPRSEGEAVAVKAAMSSFF